MRGRHPLLGALFLLAACGRTTTKQSSDASANHVDSGGTNTSDASTIDASTCHGDVEQSAVSTEDAGAPLCFAPPNGWVEQKIVVGQPNHGFFGPLDGDDFRIAALGYAYDAKGDSKGTVYFYRRAGNAWQPDGVILDAAENEPYIDSVTVDGSTLAIGASRAESGVGAVYVYVTESGVSRLEQRISYPHGSSSILPGFGKAVALRGNVLFVGAWNDSTSGAASGRVYVYERAAGTWSLTSEIIPTDIAENDSFGSQIAFDGTRLAVYAERFRGGPSDDLVYVFARGASGWQEEARMPSRDSSSDESDFVREIALDGDTLLIRTVLGRVFAYGRSTGVWALDQVLSASNPGSIDVRGTVAAFGGPEAVEIYDKSTSGWVLRETLHAGDEPKVRGYGGDIILGPGSIVVLAQLDDDWGSGSGSMYAYAKSSTACYVETCIDESTTSGAGTACTRSGATAAVCKDLPSDEGSLQGTTPVGPLDLHYAWLDIYSAGAELKFTGATPRRLDALPSVSVPVESFTSSSAPIVMETEATVDLCDQTLSVPARVTLTTGHIEYGNTWSPIAGTLVIDSPGWNVTAAFSFDAVCLINSFVEYR